MVVQNTGRVGDSAMKRMRELARMGWMRERDGDRCSLLAGAKSLEVNMLSS